MRHRKGLLLTLPPAIFVAAWLDRQLAHGPRDRAQLLPELRCGGLGFRTKPSFLRK